MRPDNWKWKTGLIFAGNHRFKTHTAKAKSEMGLIAISTKRNANLEVNGRKQLQQFHKQCWAELDWTELKYRQSEIQRKTFRVPNEFLREMKLIGLINKTADSIRMELNSVIKGKLLSAEGKWRASQWREKKVRNGRRLAVSTTFPAKDNGNKYSKHTTDLAWQTRENQFREVGGENVDQLSKWRTLLNSYKKTAAGAFNHHSVSSIRTRKIMASFKLTVSWASFNATVRIYIAE